MVLYGVLFPLWISVLVRTFSWMLLLERGGPINRFLLLLGVIERPIALLFNDIGVIIGMVHVMIGVNSSRIASQVFTGGGGLCRGPARP